MWGGIFGRDSQNRRIDLRIDCGERIVEKIEGIKEDREDKVQEQTYCAERRERVRDKGLDRKGRDKRRNGRPNWKEREKATYARRADGKDFNTWEFLSWGIWISAERRVPGRQSFFMASIV